MDRPIDTYREAFILGRVVRSSRSNVASFFLDGALKNGVPVVSGKLPTSDTIAGSFAPLKAVANPVDGLSTLLKLDAFGLVGFMRGVAGLEELDADPVLSFLLLFEPVLERLASEFRDFSPSSSLYLRIFRLNSCQALSKAVLSYSENGFGGCFTEVLPIFGGGSGDRGSSIGIWLV